VPDTRTTYDGLARVYVPVAVAVFVLVVGVLAVVLVRDRARPGRSPSRTSQAPRLELAYVALIAAVVGVLVWRTFDAVSAEGTVAPAAGPGAAAVTVHAVAARWVWRFEYPGGVVQQGAMDKGAAPERPAVLVVPAASAVRIELTSLDVVHAFWIPGTDFKYDALPGRTNTFDVLFRPGVTYDDARCSEFCGQYHTQMTFRVRVLAPAAFRSWLRRAQQRAAAA
jgi:cytochrome c oxidase subunit 2